MAAAEMQPVKFTFMKKGLTPNEFQDCLTSKVNKLFKDFNIPFIKTLMTTKVVDVRKEVCIRENRTKDSLDKRSPKSIKNLANNKLLSSEETTPTRDRQATSGRQGIERSDRCNTKTYHNEQHQLFENLLIPKFEDVFVNVELREVNEVKGFFFWCHGGRRLTTEEFCYFIDQITTEYIELFSQLKDNTINGTDLNREELEDVYDCCLFILEGRVAVDWTAENDLMHANGYDVWKRHVLVEMSYAALAVVLAMISSELDKSRNSGPRRKVEFTTSDVTTINVTTTDVTTSDVTTTDVTTSTNGYDVIGTVVAVIILGIVATIRYKKG